jgi:hypothetical protein
MTVAVGRTCHDLAYLVKVNSQWQERKGTDQSAALGEIAERTWGCTQRMSVRPSDRRLRKPVHAIGTIPVLGTVCLQPLQTLVLHGQQCGCAVFPTSVPHLPTRDRCAQCHARLC